MNKEHIIQAIQHFDNGYNNYNQGNIFCFLHKDKWYPLRALINYASGLSGDNIEYTKDRAMVKIHEFLDYVKIEQIEIQNDFLVSLTIDEKMEEIKVLSRMINELTN